MVVEVDLRAASLARTLVRKAQAVQIPAAMEAVLLADLDLASKMAAMEVVLHLADLDLDLANRLLADHQAARVLAKTQRLEIQHPAAAELLLVPQAMVNRARMGVQATAAMEALRAVRVLAKTAKTAVPVLARLAARAARVQVLATVEAARARAPTADLRRTKGKAAVQFLVPLAATPKTAQAHRTKGKAVP
jgi:hypothetical protein